MIDFKRKRTTFDMNGCQNMDMKDREDNEMYEGDIVECAYQEKKMYGYIRYSFGRFEVLCPFKDQRLILGLNPSYKIVGNINKKCDTITKQMRKKFNA